MWASTTTNTHRVPQQSPRHPSTVAAIGPDEAGVLWTHVEQARAAVREMRGTDVTGSSTKRARSRGECLEALQAYTDCLLAHQRPVPYQLRDELRLLQLTCATDPTH